MRLGHRVLPQLGDLDTTDDLVGAGGDVARGLGLVLTRRLVADAVGLDILAADGDRDLKDLGQVGARAIARLVHRRRLAAPGQILGIGIAAARSRSPNRAGPVPWHNRRSVKKWPVSSSVLSLSCSSPCCGITGRDVMI